MKGKMPGMFSGKVFKGTNPNREGVQYGPNTHEGPEDPMDILLKKSMGEVKRLIEPNGYMYIDPSKCQYLKS